jgi:2,3-bisphosphoglycerate-dependent phosphoglycerate mutase
MTRGRLHLVRHARTAGNRVRYVGWGDEPLDDVGRAQARALAEQLADERIDVVYSSPLSRALDTARPIAAAHGAPLHVRDGLKEIHYGDYQDTPKGERKLKLKRNHRVDPLPGGESLRDVFDRVAVVRAEVEAELRAGRGVAVVAHFWSLRMLAGQLDGLSFDEVLARDDYSPENGVATTRFGAMSP